MQIENYPNYKIYPNGQVENVKTGKILKPVLDGHGYLCISLCNINGKKTHKIHKLLGKYYVANPNNYNCIDHIDRCRTNNMLINLRWCTYQENNLNRNNFGNSQYRGVSFNKKTQKWEAYVPYNKKKKHLGIFITENEAAQAYNDFILNNDMNIFYRNNLNIIQEQE